MGQLVFQAALGGQVNLVGPNTASTFNLNVPAVAGTVVTTGDTATVTSTMISGPLTTAVGGTGLASYTAGDISYYASGTALSKLAIGTANFVLTSSGTAPQWTASTGSGSVVLATSPTLVTPVLGVASATTVNKVTLTAPATGSTLTVADGKTLTASNSITLAGTDATTMTFPPASASVGYLNVPINSQSAAYTTVLADSGKAIFHPSTDANARTFTIDSNANVAYAVGTVLTFINMTSQVVTIAITSDTMYLAGTGTTGSRSLAQYGMATAIKMTSTTWIISGSGLT
jgi:hypothetical protein